MKRNIYIKNKKGDKLISVYWFAILFIVAAAVSFMVISFYGEPYDIREAEASALANRVANCVTEDNYLREDIFEGEFQENFLSECRITFNVEDTYNWREREQYYVAAAVSDFDSGENILSVQEGDANLRDFCGEEGKTLPVCIERSFYSLDEEGNRFQVNIISIVRKTEKNVH
ncbi:MAG: hypothetical protein WDZ69_03065 [Candidatus Pacearchaeota archaeon]